MFTSHQDGKENNSKMLLFPRETSPPGLFCSNSNETHVRALSSWRQDPAPPASPHLRRRWVYNSSQGSVNYNPASCLPLFLFSSFRLGLLARSPRLSTAESLYLFPRKPRLVCFPLASFFLLALIEPLVNPGTWKPEKHGPESHLFTSCFPVFPLSCLVFFFFSGNSPLPLFFCVLCVCPEDVGMQHTSRSFRRLEKSSVSCRRSVRSRGGNERR